MVAHGLGLTPLLQDILLTPNTNWGSTTKWWVDTITATTFTINLDLAPGISFGFSWKAAINRVINP